MHQDRDRLLALPPRHLGGWGVRARRRARAVYDLSRGPAGLGKRLDRRADEFLHRAGSAAAIQAEGVVKLLWQLRRRIVTQLENAPVEERAGLRAALRGIDLLLRTNLDYKAGGRWDPKRN